MMARCTLTQHAIHLADRLVVLATTILAKPPQQQIRPRKVADAQHDAVVIDAVGRRLHADRRRVAFDVLVILHAQQLVRLLVVAAAEVVVSDEEADELLRGIVEGHLLLVLPLLRDAARSPLTRGGGTVEWWDGRMVRE